MHTYRALLADDHAIVRSGLRNALKALPNLTVVQEVGDGLGLKASLAEQEFDILLVDVTMPNFEAIQDIRQIRADFPDLKILVVSAFDDNIYVQGLLNAGVNGYHMKDQPLSDLQLAVQRVLDGERWVSSRLLDQLITPTASQANAPLSARKREILQLLLTGHDNSGMARIIGISVKTVENHLTKLYRQIGVQSRLEAVNFAREHPELLQSAVSPPALQTVQPKPTSQHIRPTILIVDDNHRFRAQLVRLVQRLQPTGIVESAHDSQTAVEKAATLTPKLIFVDVVLGDEDGIRLAKRLRDQSASARIILISAYPDREFRNRAMETGANAFLDKKDLDSAAMRQILNDVFPV